MQIESIIKRVKGHTVELGDQTYEFLPPDYVAEVEDPDHIGRFLSIVEGYRAAGASGEIPLVKPKSEASSQVILLGSDVHPSAFEINGKEYSLGDVVQLAFAAAQMNHEAWNGLSEGERADLIDAELDKLENAKNRDELTAEYEAKFGKKPHHRLSAEKIQAAIDGGAEE